MTTEQALSVFWMLMGFLTMGVGLVLIAGWRASRTLGRREGLRDYATLHHLAAEDSIHFMCPKCWQNFYGPLEQFGEIPLCSNCGTQCEATGFVHKPTEGQS